MAAVNEVADIIITPARVWLAPEGETLPDESTVNYGGDWGGNWEYLGATTTPVTLAISAEETEPELQQVIGAVKRVRHKESYTIETTLAELSADNTAKALNGTSTNTPAGAGQRAFDQIKAGGKYSLKRYAIGFEGMYVDDDDQVFPVRAFVLICTITLNGNLQFSKSDVAGLPIQAKALYDPSKPEGEQAFLMHKVTGAATT